MPGLVATGQGRVLPAAFYTLTSKKRPDKHVADNIHHLYILRFILWLLQLSRLCPFLIVVRTLLTANSLLDG